MLIFNLPIGIFFPQLGDDVDSGWVVLGDLRAAQSLAQDFCSEPFVEGVVNCVEDAALGL